MNFLLRILINGITAYYLVGFLPWWFIIIVPFFLGFSIKENYFTHFLSGFIGIGIAWIFLIINNDISNQSIISEKIIEILKIKNVNLLIIYASVIGGFIGGLASITGYSLQRIFIKNIPRSTYRD
jgi:hypothetical protein|tara:strand:- start:2849 stop:3223 length:375 start_codon:yes stop_codon:yes gene_type:complete